MDRLFGNDTGVANAASMAALVEVEGRTILLAGDARAETLEQSIKRLLDERAVRRLRLDVFVVAHGGSRRNITPELLDLVEVRTFVISTSGRMFQHPDRETIELIMEKQPTCTIAFNYRSQQERLAPYVGTFAGGVMFPPGDEDGIRIDLD